MVINPPTKNRLSPLSPVKHNITHTVAMRPIRETLLRLAIQCEIVACGGGLPADFLSPIVAAIAETIRRRGWSPFNAAIVAYCRYVDACHAIAPRPSKRQPVKPKQFVSRLSSGNQPKQKVA